MHLLMALFLVLPLNCFLRKVSRVTNNTLFLIIYSIFYFSVSAEHNAVDNSFKTVVNVKLWGNKQIDSDHVVDCKEWKMPLLQEFLHHDILDFGFDIPIFMSIASFRLIVQGLYEPMMNVKFCAERMDEVSIQTHPPTPFPLLTHPILYKLNY